MDRVLDLRHALLVTELTQLLTSLRNLRLAAVSKHSAGFLGSISHSYRLVKEVDLSGLPPEASEQHKEPMSFFQQKRMHSWLLQSTRNTGAAMILTSLVGCQRAMCRPLPANASMLLALYPQSDQLLLMIEYLSTA